MKQRSGREGNRKTILSWIFIPQSGERNRKLLMMTMLLVSSNTARMSKKYIELICTKKINKCWKTESLTTKILFTILPWTPGKRNISSSSSWFYWILLLIYILIVSSVVFVVWGEKCVFYGFFWSFFSVFWVEKDS